MAIIKRNTSASPSKEQQSSTSVDTSSSTSTASIESVDFLFQDNVTTTMLLSSLEKYPSEVLSLIQSNEDNYVKDKKAYYVDFPSLSINKLIPFLEGKKSLDSIPLKDICRMYQAGKYFFGNEIRSQLAKIEDFLSEALTLFIEQNNCKLNIESLYDYTIKRELIIQVDFSDDIPYEYIYPSNLHELFPKLEIFEMNASYYPQNKEIQITRNDPNYRELYKEYKRLYYEYNYPEAYNRYKSLHPDIEKDKLYKYQIDIHSKKDKDRSISDNKESTIINHEIIPIDIDEELLNEKEDSKPDLYIQAPTSYSHLCIHYAYIERDESHPILKYHNNPCYEILNYILNIPICTQLRSIDIYSDLSYKLQLTISPLLQALKQGIFDAIQIFNISDYIHPESYSAYKQLFIEILETHVFTNVTTLKIENSRMSESYIVMLTKILPLIKRDNFPNLHVYDLCDFTISTYPTTIFNMIHCLLPVSLLKLMDTILIDIKKMNYPFDFTEKTIENVETANKIHPITINFDEITMKQSPSFFNEYIAFLSSGTYKNAISLVIKGKPYFNIDSVSYISTPVNVNMNNNNMWNGRNNYNNGYNVQTYSFVDYIFLTNDFMNRPLLTNLQQLSITFDNRSQITTIFGNIIQCIKNNKLTKLKSLSIQYDVIDNSLYTQLYTFIDSFKDITEASLAYLETFTLLYNGKINVFEAFPSLSLYLQKSCTSICMCSLFNTIEDTYKVYSEYIYKQLQMDYVKNSRNLELYINVDYYPVLENYKEICNSHLEIIYLNA
ncbi:hypothetical protein WA158_007488 [Blastocystis sp. Blastoise]